MGIRRVFSFFTGLVLLLLCATAIPEPTYAQACRDPLQQPFAANSIWNTPIGSGARFVPANFKLPANGWGAEENVIIMKPNAPKKPIQIAGHNGWGGDQQARCGTPGGTLHGGKQLPVPDGWTTVFKLRGQWPNASGGILDSDGKTIYQSQPLTVCGNGSPVTSYFPKATVDLYGDGIQGGQGGSAMSSVGGAIRLSEMKAGYRIPHALKLVIYGVENMSRSNGGYRWPALQADSEYNAPCSNGNAYCGSNTALRMGALLALPPSVDVNSLGLQAESSKMIARALKEYGGYVVDNSAWSYAHIAVEFGPDGSGVDKLATLGGFNSADINKIFSKIEIVDNNTASSIGGGGTPTAPTALPFCTGGEVEPTTPPVQPTTPPGGTCPAKPQGDADCKNGVSLADFAIWKAEYSSGTGKTADFNTDTKVTLADFQIWRNTYVGSGGGGGGGTNPTAVPTTPPTGGGITKPIKIVGIGDSITGQSNAWTYALQDRMRADSCTAGSEYDFIGYDAEFPNPDSAPYASRGPSGYDHQRISRGGFNARGMLNVVKDKGFGGTPDVVITYLSVNNYGTGYVDGVYNPPGDGTDATLKKDLKEMIEYARTKNPKVTVILGSLQTGQGSSVMTSLASEMSTATSKVYATGQPAFGGGDVHSIPPDNIAVKMYEKLKPVLDANNICN